jgi:hypothetical protein
LRTEEAGKSTLISFLAAAVPVVYRTPFRLHLLATVPRITIKSGLPDSDGQEEELVEYICDAPGCPNIATRVLGCIVGLGLVSAVCQEHLTSKLKLTS